MKAYLNNKIQSETYNTRNHSKARNNWTRKTNITPFEAYLCRKCNTPASNITTKTNGKNLKYKKNKYYLDKDTIQGRSYLTVEQWADTGMCSDVEIERIICAGNARGHEKQRKMKDEENRLMCSVGFSRPVPRSERSIQMKIAAKFIPQINETRT